MKEGSCQIQIVVVVCVCVCFLAATNTKKKTLRSRQDNISSSDMRKCFSCHLPKMYARLFVCVCVCVSVCVCVCVCEANKERTGKKFGLTRHLHTAHAKKMLLLECEMPAVVWWFVSPSGWWILNRICARFRLPREMFGCGKKSCSCFVPYQRNVKSVAWWCLCHCHCNCPRTYSVISTRPANTARANHLVAWSVSARTISDINVCRIALSRG